MCRKSVVWCHRCTLYYRKCCNLRPQTSQCLHFGPRTVRLDTSTEICIINWVLFYKTPNLLQDKGKRIRIRSMTARRQRGWWVGSMAGKGGWVTDGVKVFEYSFSDPPYNPAHEQSAKTRKQSVYFQSLSSGFHPCMLILSLRSSLQSQVAVCQKSVEKREEKRADYKKGIRREKSDKREKGRRGLLCPLVWGEGRSIAM